MNNDKTKQHSQISTEQSPEINIPPNSDINLLALSINTWQKLFQNNFEHTQNTLLNIIQLMSSFSSNQQQQDFLVQTIKINTQRNQNAQEIINEAIAKYNTNNKPANTVANPTVPNFNSFNWLSNLIVNKEIIAPDVVITAPFTMPSKLMP